MDLSVIDVLEQLAPVLAVYGNMDEPEIRGKLPKLNFVKVSDWKRARFKTRDFHEKDVSTLVEIFCETFSDEVSRGMQQITAERFVEFSKRLGVKIFVSESEESKVVAFLAMTEGSIELPAQIHMVAVRQDFRGRGIVKELVRKALEHAKAVGREKVKLFTRCWNLAMRKVCVELGFVPEVCLRKDYLD